MDKYYILVEGKTDKEILDFYIEMAYPQYKNNLYIVPFETPARIGGKDYISHIVKAIIHIEQENKKVVTLFDNDTEGIYTKELLLKDLNKSNIDLKKKYNCIKILSYPDIKFLKKYPVYKTKVHSKNKIESDNINQRAAAIELYLPKLFLTDSNTGALIPIRWQTYNEAVNKYQGSFQDKVKKEVMDKFRNARQLIQKDSSLFDKNEWSSCDLIIKLLINELKI
ncbi:MAG: hypothetical protein PHP65_00155 [Bacilli bacterium]|nr:hypothetical protein [Bacilli bacterium]